MTQNNNRTPGRPVQRPTGPVQRPTAGKAVQRPVQRAQAKAPQTKAPQRVQTQSQQAPQGFGKEKLLLIAAAAVALVLVIVLIVLAVGRGGRPAEQAATVLPTLQPTPVATVKVSAEPTPEPTTVPASDVADADRAKLRPKAKSNLLPIFAKAKTEEKIIAITVDDCFQANNLLSIVDTAIANNAKVTIFPIGNVALREKQRAILKYAHDNGMEIENHTWSHNGLFDATDESVTGQIYKQDLAISDILGVEYQMHFLRPRGGDARADERIHAYARQLGYKGIAHWNISGSGSSKESLAKTLAPGNIYLFHTTDGKDWAKLEWFIPYAVSEGYQLVTLNEMFGYPENETAPIEVPLPEQTIPPLEPYESVMIDMSKGTYDSRVQKLQRALIKLGYLDGEADGSYGAGTVKAVKAFQKAAGAKKQDGVATIKLQEYLYALVEGTATPIPGSSHKSFVEATAAPTTAPDAADITAEDTDVVEEAEGELAELPELEPVEEPEE